MNVIIGEIISDFTLYNDDKDGVLYQQTLSGATIGFAELLRSVNRDFEIITKLGGDSLSLAIENTIRELYGKDLEYSIHSPFLSAISIDGDVRLTGTAPATMSVEELELMLSKLKPDNILISGALLSVNPASSAIVDAIGFVSPNAKLFIDLSLDARVFQSMELLNRAVNTLSAMQSTFIIGDAIKSQKASTIEKSHILDYLE